MKFCSEMLSILQCQIKELEVMRGLANQGALGGSWKTKSEEQIEVDRK